MYPVTSREHGNVHSTVSWTSMLAARKGRYSPCEKLNFINRPQGGFHSLISWLRAALLLAIVGFLLVDIYLFEVVIVKAHSYSGALLQELKGHREPTRSGFKVRLLKDIHEPRQLVAPNSSEKGSEKQNSLRVERLSSPKGQSDVAAAAPKLFSLPANLGELPESLQLPLPTVKPIRGEDKTAPFIGLNSNYSSPDVFEAEVVSEESHLPPGFDWRAYLDYNQDVQSVVEDNAESATAHYASHGHKEGRIYKRIPVVMRYTACGGLMNQHYSHLAAMTVAASLGADLVLPKALKRGSFNQYFSNDPEKNEVTWSMTPFSSLWDKAHIQHFLREQGVGSWEVNDTVAKLPRLIDPHASYQRYSMDGFGFNQVVKVPNVYLQTKDLQEIVQHLRTKIVEQAMASARHINNHTREPQPILVDLPCTMFWTKSGDNHALRLVAQNLQFAPEVVAAADQVLKGMVALGYGEFNGLHLRLENDAADWTNVIGGRRAFWDLYLDQCEEAKFNPSTPLYLASGMSSAHDSEKLKEATVELKPYSSIILMKENFLGPDFLAKLHPDQQALIDFLVLVRCKHFVGFSASTFSVYVQQYRHIMDIAPKSTSYLINATVVGTEPLFARAAVFS